MKGTAADEGHALFADPAGLRVRGLQWDQANRKFRGALAPEVLLLALGIVADQAVGGIQDDIAAAIVLLEFDQLRSWKHPFEFFEGFIHRPTPTVD